MKLHAVYFQPGISIVSRVTGYHSSIQYWDRDKHGKITCEEQKNGDVWLTHPDGARSEISVLAISHKVRVPDAPVKSEPVRHNVAPQVRP